MPGKSLQLPRTESLLKGDKERVEFGHPGDPYDETSVQLAGDITGVPAHNGTLEDIEGSWVTISIEAVGRTTHRCHHNLYLQEPGYVVPVATSPNVRWVNFGWTHDGTLADATTELMLNIWHIGTAVTATYIDLEVSVDVHAVAAPTIDATHPILLTLFFTKAIQ